MITQEDRCNLVKVSRHFYDLFVPILYRSIEVEGLSIISLVRTLLRKRQLTQYVWTLSLGKLPGYWDMVLPGDQKCLKSRFMPM